MNRSLTGKNAIVTGASRGIGAGIAIALAEAGANVAINCFGDMDNAKEVAEQCKEYGNRVRIAEGDIGNHAEVERLVHETVEEFGSVDIGVSNAAFSEREVFYEADMAGFERTIQVTMWGAFFFVRAVTNQMLKAKTEGSMVVVSSPLSWKPVPGAMAYNMSKAAIDQMAKTAATELVSKKIRVNIVHPGWIDTPGERKFFSEEKLQRLAAGTPWGRLGKPAEIARGVLFLCDPASEFITGSTLLMDGGINLPVQEMHRLQLPTSEKE